MLVCSIETADVFSDQQWKSTYMYEMSKNYSIIRDSCKDSLMTPETFTNYKRKECSSL